MNAAILTAHDLRAFYGRRPALHGVSFSVESGKVTVLLGANGAGKTTVLRAISRLVRTEGHLELDGASLAQKSTEDVAKLGVGHVPDGRGTLVDLTVEENLRVGAYLLKKAQLAQGLERMFVYFPKLKERRGQQAGTLSGGEQQMLAIGRALIAGPRLLLLDEPSFGLAPMIVSEVFDILKEVNRREGVSMLLVEQNARLALQVCNIAYLMESGRIVRSGTRETIELDDSIRRSYLGY